MRRIGKYRILGLLGRGGMGAVYKVLHEDLGRIAALKLLAPAEMLEAVVGADELKRRFVLEARTMASLRHGNIAPVWDMGHDENGRPFFVMEYCCNNLGTVIGETYRVEDPSRVLRIDKAAGITLQTLEGLARLHFEGIVHRDVKPFNVLLENGGHVRLIDFGLSKLRGERLDIHGSENVGSPYYAAPEQEADPEAAIPASDLFSVGVMLQRMLTGRLPQLACEPPSACNPDLDPEWDAFLRRAVAPNPEERFSTARAMSDALMSLLEQWRKRTEGVCGLPPEIAEEATAGEAPVTPLRSGAVRTGPKVGPDYFGLDKLWRPRQYVSTDFRVRDNDTIEDSQSGLIWQRGGSEYALNRGDALEYVAQMDDEKFAGRTGWRLPTVSELMTLLTPVAHGQDFCIEPVFDQAKGRLWSADRRTYTNAWTADTELGFIGFHDFTCRLHVRAVCGMIGH